MRRWLALLLVLGLAGAALGAAGPTGNRLSTEGKGLNNGDGAVSPRVGGEDIPGAALIPGLPFSDTGATCGYGNDYDEVCPYTGSTAPDVVYKYTPVAGQAVTVDLCASQYDTKVYIYAGGVGNLVACNDDAGCGYSGWQSKISDVALSPGVTYYIVVDGYGGGCGTYDFRMIAYVPCVVNCPPGGLIEGEPPCGPNYEDHYNGGCNSDPPVFNPLGGAIMECLDLCGKSGTYIYQGLSYRDTDWFVSEGIGGDVTTQCTAEFPLQLLFIWNADCNNVQYDIATAEECQTAILTRFVGGGVEFWTWVGPQVFSGIPCDADYVLNVCSQGPPPVPTRETSWGALKNLYR